MLPAILNGLRGDSIPSCFRHQHNLKQIDLINIVLARFIEFNCSLTECIPVMHLETSNNSRIEGLHERCHVWREVLNMNVLWLIRNIMGRKIVNHQTNLSVLSFEMPVKRFDPPYMSYEL
jgi:hypothetical protein